MKRRNFIKASFLSGLSMTIPSYVSCSPDKKSSVVTNKISSQDSSLKLKKLKIGDTIGLIAPSSALSSEKAKKAISNMKSMGFKVKTSKHFYEKKGFLSSSDENRLSDLHDFFLDDTIDAIVCGRGGYGSMRILDKIDYSIIKSNPKIFVGFSDITALHYAIYKNTGIHTFHGPVAASDFTDFTKNSFLSELVKPLQKIALKGSDKAKIINKGEAKGEIVIGNLSMMVSLLGTPYDIDFSNKIVVIEEVSEPSYKIDRMLTQMRLAGKFDNVKGIVFGDFKDCKLKKNSKYENLKFILKDRVGGYNIPIVYGMPIGHDKDNATIPFGALAHLNANNNKISFIVEDIF